MTCTHIVGFIPKQGEMSPADWNEKLIAFMAVIDDFNVRGQRYQVAHPGQIDEYKFCPQCGAAIDRSALGLMTFSQALDSYQLSKTQSVG
jgi:hypothetical protein